MSKTIFRRPGLEQLLLAGLLLLVGARDVFGAEAAVTVTRAPVTVQRRTFDPRRPPADMPPLAPSEAGVCRSEFQCETRVTIGGPKVASAETPTRVLSVGVNLRLEIVIWTIARPPEKLRAHEEAHRMIAETYYARAMPVARRLARQLVGRRLSVGVDDGPAMKATLEKLQNDLQKELQRDTSRRCFFAQDQFDRITNHGLNAISESDAIAQALNADARNP